MSTDEYRSTVTSTEQSWLNVGQVLQAAERLFDRAAGAGEPADVVVSIRDLADLGAALHGVQDARVARLRMNLGLTPAGAPMVSQPSPWPRDGGSSGGAHTLEPEEPVFYCPAHGEHPHANHGGRCLDCPTCAALMFVDGPPDGHSSTKDGRRQEGEVPR